MKESAGVSKIEEQVMTSASPIKKMEELATASICMDFTSIFSFRTLIFTFIGPLFTVLHFLDYVEPKWVVLKIGMNT